MILDIPDEIVFESKGDHLRFTFDGLSTNWMSDDDPFLKRISTSSLNPSLLERHIAKEIEIKNILDEGIAFFKAQKYSRAIGCFDEVIFYDSCYGESLLNKSFCLCGQRHFIKALRHYKKAVRADGNLKDVEYHRTLIGRANNERDGFPKIKSNIYLGDEHFAKGEFEKAIESYDKALADSSGFKQKILSKLLNKKATALLKLDGFEEALVCFDESLNVEANDYAYFGKGLCQYSLGLNVHDRFKGRLDISKKQMLEQVFVLNGLGFYCDALKISEYLCCNHFKVDEFYLKLKKAHESARDGCP